MNRRILLYCSLLISLIGAVACSDKEDEGGSGACTDLTYATFAQPLLQQNCVGCHSGQSAASGVRLDSLSGVRANRLGINQHAVRLMEPAMPYNQAPLPRAERDLLEEWLDCGAP